MEVRVAMVLAAGRGRRMRPLSDVLPKPALPVLDRPVVRWALEQAAAAGVGRVVVNTWHLAPLMESAVEEGVPPGLDVSFSREPELMGGAGGLALARDRGLLGREGPVLVINGDGLVDLDLGPLLERHRSAGDLVTLALLPHPEPTRWSRVLLDGRGAVERILPPGHPGRGETPRLYPGVMLVARRALEALPSGPGETGELLWSPALERGRLGGAEVAGRWAEVGTPGDYLRVVLEALPARGWIHPSAVVEPGAVVERSMVGPGVRLETGARLVRSVAGHGAVVRRGATVVESVLLGAVEAGPGELLEGETRAAPPGGEGGGSRPAPVVRR